MKKIVFSLFLTWAALASAFQGKVVKVADGDTITVITNNKKIKVRFYGIDAPELKQDYGKKSLDSLQKLLINKNVEIQQIEKDQYGRTVAKVFLNNDEINLLQIEKGNAWHYRNFAKNETSYAAAEKHARDLKLELWQNVTAVAPWEFRRNLN